jgi:arylsulfatase A-like enzyme
MKGKRLFFLLSFLMAVPAAADTQRPNVILILMDDMGWGDLPSYQDQRMKEGFPAMDNPGLRMLAREGMTLTRHYSSAPLCAPARASLFTGVHQGHVKVIRDRSFDLPIEQAPTLGTVMQAAGYKTALIGKWGIGGGTEHAGSPQESTAYPTKRGFDYYFGYLDHVSGHHHYPKEDPNPISPTKKSGIWDGNKCVTGDCDKAYSVDLLTARAKQWIMDTHRQNPRKPFFLALTHTAPHSQLQIPTGPYPEGRGVKGGVQWVGKPHKLINTAEGKINSYIYPRYAEKKWPIAQKRYATMIARLSDSFEDLIQTLKDLNIDKNIVIIMTSDNGPHDEGGQNPQFFRNYGPFDGIKQDAWEGGFRVPAIVRWPGRIPAGSSSDHPSQFHDWMATLAAIGGVRAPFRSDGVSLLPTLLNQENQPDSRLYMEYSAKKSRSKTTTPAYQDFHPSRRNAVRGEEQMVYIGKYKGVRTNIQSHADLFEIYDTVRDPAERHDLKDTPEGKKMQSLMRDKVLRMRRIYDYTHPARGTFAQRPYDTEPVPALRKEEMPGNLLPLEESSSQGVRRKDGSMKRVLYLNIPETGNYVFFLKTPVKKGAKAFVRLHDAHLLDAEYGYNPGTEVSSSMGEGTTEGDAGQTGRKPIPLEKGWHPLMVETEGFSGLPTLFWQKEGGKKEAIPNSALHAAVP